MSELELLERFRDDVPEPSTDAWLRARAAVSAAKREARPKSSGLPRRRGAHPAVLRASALGFAGLAAVAALVLGLTGVLGSTSGRGPAATRTHGGASSVRTMGFTLTADANGTLTLTMSQMLDPTALQQALEQHGVPTLVETDTYCTSNPPAPDPISTGVLTTQPSMTSAVPRLVPAPGPSADGPQATLPGQTGTGSPIGAKTVINPAAMPAGTELFFDFAPGDNLVAPNLIYANAYTCTVGTQFPDGKQ